ncbi:GAF and ANTAR domain-containing protein [Actinoplanes sp. CA-015351]|uniref:GAF and ANTAR domain-containing protein n=1 Tax=Actinoplanes sp. CA-015351 TaxID=3239897 RepID=UPI003D95FB67
MTVIPQRLAAVFVEVADTMVDRFDLTVYLRMLADRVTALTAAQAAGVLVADRGGCLGFVTGSGDSALTELLDLQQSEGPCLDAYRTGEPIINADPREAARRWPRFTPQAARAGFRSVHAFPLRQRDQVIGAVNVFSAAEGERFSDADTAVVQALAEVAAGGLLRRSAIRRGEALAGQLQDALNSRVVIEQAKGVVAQATGVSVEEAFTAIRHRSRQHNHRLTDVARQIVTDAGSRSLGTTSSEA